MSELKPKVGEWWICEHTSIMGNGDSISANKMTHGLIIAGNVKPIERLYSEKDRDRMVEEIAELREFVCSLQLDVSNEIKLENLLAKLNQEGEG